MRGKLHPDLQAFLRRTLEIDPRRRYPDARQMLAAFRRLKPRVRRFMLKQRRRRNGVSRDSTRTDWKQIRFRHFERQYRNVLRLDRHCTKCRGPTSEAMSICPWCGTQPKFAGQKTSFPVRCPRCDRGHKLDWRYCAWCYGAGFDDVADRSYADRRYESRCGPCRGQLMPFMRYCPWCRRKVRKPWRIAGERQSCSRCGWVVLNDYWDHCPWCEARIRRE